MRRERITGLDLGPSSPSSPEPERPDSLPGLLGVPVSLCFWTACKRKSSPLLGVCKARPGSYLLFEYFWCATPLSRVLLHNKGAGSFQDLDFWSFPSDIPRSAGFCSWEDLQLPFWRLSSRVVQSWGLRSQRCVGSSTGLGLVQVTAPVCPNYFISKVGLITVPPF